MLWRWLKWKNEASPNLRDQLAVELPELNKEPFDKEIQVGGKVILQEIHNRSKVLRAAILQRLSYRAGKASSEAKRLLIITLNVIGGDDIHLLDDRTSTVEKISSKIILGPGYWPKTPSTA